MLGTLEMLNIDCNLTMMQACLWIVIKREGYPMTLEEFKSKIEPSRLFRAYVKFLSSNLITDADIEPDYIPKLCESYANPKLLSVARRIEEIVGSTIANSVVRSVATVIVAREALEGTKLGLIHVRQYCSIYACKQDGVLKGCRAIHKFFLVSQGKISKKDKQYYLRLYTLIDTYDCMSPSEMPAESSQSSSTPLQNEKETRVTKKTK